MNSTPDDRILSILVSAGPAIRLGEDKKAIQSLLSQSAEVAFQLLRGTQSSFRDCPVWPVDLFAFCGIVLQQSGTYAFATDLMEQLVKESSQEEPRSNAPLRAVPIDPWPVIAEGAAAEWREILTAHIIGNNRVALDSMPKTIPGDVAELWKAACGIWGGGPSEPSGIIVEQAIVALLCLFSIADQTCEGFGICGATDLKDEAQRILSEQSRGRSLAIEPDHTSVVVLPKVHTPQRGFTLRSLSHHLALILPGELNVEWRYPMEGSGDAMSLDFFGILIVPWPFEVQASQFSYLGLDATSAPKFIWRGSDHQSAHGYFQYTPPSNGQALVDAIANLWANLSNENRIAIKFLVLPELAISEGETTELIEFARAQNLVLICGVAGEKQNQCWVKFPSDRDATRHSKHHRWCLDHRQVDLYDLASRLPASPTRLLWEDSEIGTRSITFHTVHNGTQSGLTFSCLICEDLARQDPAGRIVRTIGPNLLFSLLLDGPQLKQRWSSRYAAILAEDPGTSILALTSLGMAKRTSKKDTPESTRNGRSIALWCDSESESGAEELRVDEERGEVAGVVWVTLVHRDEWTIDGRNDKTAVIPKMTGWQPIRRRA